MQASPFRQFRTGLCRLSQLSAHHQALPTQSIAYPEFIRRNLAEEEAEATASYYTADNVQVEDAPPVRRSQAASDGSARIGMVILPTELQLAVNHLIQGGDKPLLRQRALQLYEYFRSSTKAEARRRSADSDEGADTRHEKQPSRPFFDGTTALAYTAGVMPAVFASTHAVLAEARKRFDLLAGADSSAWRPEKVVDWGAGVGTVAWAVKEAWPDLSFKYVGLDSARAMQMISAALLAQISSQSISTKLHQTSLGAPDLQQLIDDSHSDISPSDTMAIAAYTLGDMPNETMRKETVRKIWDSGAEVMVIIDRGTPKGFNIVASARDQLLRLGRHAEGNRARFKAAAQDFDDAPDANELVIGDEVFHAETASGQMNMANPEQFANGCHVIAPCPHDGVCPLHKTADFCHFSQKLQRPAFLRKTKHSGNNEEPSSYSYVVIKRGRRPADDAQNWPRLIVPPLKRGKHVILDACCPTENIERFTIAKSTGKQEYYDARKAKWGETFPHWDKVESTKKTAGLNR